jgi:hypothetical protein
MEGAALLRFLQGWMAEVSLDCRELQRDDLLTSGDEMKAGSDNLSAPEANRLKVRESNAPDATQTAQVLA